ncbi:MULTISPECIES: phage tail sheath family protein [Methylomonas]|uniref:Phage tail protein n=1 Tax=Methylomonas koyamae TaxID=702114 RepID=A0A177NQR2_9GAMM|nr:phage tail sheath subtilisin-like domain-containing protein [Methylomonas koyamae]OAI19653.1 phage tail protein [Methylomonas koyamae]
MPVALSYPGVYIEEVPSGVRTITGVATSITAFLGRASRGPTDEPITVNSFGDFIRVFGDLSPDFPLSYAVRDFYLNGGQQALIVRLAKNATASKNADLKLEAASVGLRGDKLTYTIDAKGITAEVAGRYGIAQADLFNMTVYEEPGKGRVERFLNLAVTVGAGARRLDRVLAAESNLIRVQKKADGSADLVAGRPTDSTAAEDPADPAATPASFKKFTGGGDSALLTAEADVVGDKNNKTGLYALDKADLFNLLCIPPDTREGDTLKEVYQKGMKYCADRRAVLIVDPPAAWGANKDTAAATARDGLSGLGLSGVEARNAALYFPRVIQSDPLREGQLDVFAPSGMIAGIMARTDTARGVWKAPAGLDASLSGIQGLQVNLNDAENGMLNPLGINCLRAFPVNGRVVWGARTLRGADQLADEWKYLPVRRTALFIEESLYRGTQWVVFEPNDEPLWAQIRLNVGAFMHNLFRQGAFQGSTPREAYFVKCDRETTTQTDINSGIVNIVVGFAPLKPAEFVVIKLQQMAGQIEV